MKTRTITLPSRTAIAICSSNRQQWGKRRRSARLIVAVRSSIGCGQELNRKLIETPGRFKWFVRVSASVPLVLPARKAPRLIPERDGFVWTHRQGRVGGSSWPAAILAKTVHPRNPSQLFAVADGRLGVPVYDRIDVPGDAEVRRAR